MAIGNPAMTGITDERSVEAICSTVDRMKYKLNPYIRIVHLDNDYYIYNCNRFLELKLNDTAFKILLGFLKSDKQISLIEDSIVDKFIDLEVIVQEAE